MRAKKTTTDRTLVEMYNLLGDPAVVLERPRDEAKLILDAERWNTGVLVDLGPSRFDGNVSIDWLDAKGNKLVSSSYHTDDTRFRLPIPTPAAGKVTAMRLYAASPTTGRDAVGGIDFPKTKTPAPSKSWAAALTECWRGFTRAPYTPPVRHADTISILDFDAPPAALTAIAAEKSGSGTTVASDTR